MNLYTDKDLELIYTSFVKKPQSYFTKWTHLPQPCPIKDWNHKYDGHDFPRVWCFLDFGEWVEKYKLKNCGVLGYTCGDIELQHLNPSEKVYLDYPPHDLHQIAKDFTGRFDFFLFNQTLEHLHNPYVAVKNINLCLKPGGYVFTSVPTLNIPHSTPIHFGGFNPMGLTMLFISNGFEILEIGQWGNYDYIQKLWKTHKWPSALELMKNGIVSNEEENVCQCWILARKI